MDYDNIGRNDLCPCGSGRKFKKCHMGRENEILGEKLTADHGQTAHLITKLPGANNPVAAAMAAKVALKAASGKDMEVRLIDLKAYLNLALPGQDADNAEKEGALMVNPHKTRALEPNAIYMAVSPGADASLLLHELAHVVDWVEGSRLQAGVAAGLAREAGVPVQFLEHPQEYGEILRRLSEEWGQELDADDEIIDFLARRQMLLPAKLISAAQPAPILKAVEKAVAFLQDSRDEIGARIKGRQGYVPQPEEEPAGE